MKIRNVENMVNVKLDMSFEDAVKVQKYDPDAMVLKDEAGNEIFKVCVKKCAFGGYLGSLGTFGAEFVEVREQPTMWIGIDDIEKDSVADFILENFGMDLAKVKEVEKQMADALKAVEGKVSSVADAITVI